MRLFSILQWHHFAYMIISLALLGYGTSGTLMAFFAGGLLRRFERAWTLLAMGFGLSMPLVFLLAEQLPFNPLELLWDPWQWLWLGNGLPAADGAVPAGGTAHRYQLCALRKPHRCHLRCRPAGRRRGCAGRGGAALLAFSAAAAPPARSGRARRGIAGSLGDAQAPAGAGCRGRCPAVPGHRPAGPAPFPQPLQAAAATAPGHGDTGPGRVFQPPGEAHHGGIGTGYR